MISPPPHSLPVNKSRSRDPIILHHYLLVSSYEHYIALCVAVLLGRNWVYGLTKSITAHNLISLNPICNSFLI